MLKKTLFSVLMAISFQIFAQNNTVKNKITLAAYHELASASNEKMIPVLIQGNVPQIETFVRENAGKLKFSTKTIVSATMPASKIRMLNKENFVTLIDCPKGKLTALNDVMVLHNNVDSAYYGMWPLEMGYDGTEVVIGIIDAPFDLQHLDFTDSEGNSRIKYVWDQIASDGTAPIDYDYGIECDSTMIADGTCTIGDYDGENYSHGSGVTGVAASSGNAANRYRGVAPNAELVLVTLNFDNQYLSNVIDAIAYVYERANQLQKPCVINTSFGSYSGSHDGKDLTSQMINEMISAQNGRALVAAAGNAGNFPFHLGYEVTETEQFTWFKKLSYANMVYWQLWGDSATIQEVNFSIGADEPLAFTSLGSSPEFSIPGTFDFTDDVLDSTLFNIPGAGVVKIFAEKIGSVYQLEFIITPDFTTTYWRLTSSGSGRFDVYATEAATGFSNYVTVGLPNELTVPEIVNYRLPDVHQTTVSSWQCSDYVITVGSYVNRDTMTNYYGEYPPLIDEVGALFYSSSLGPTRDNRIKPDICAPGARVLSTGASVLTEWLISLGAANYMSQDGQHYLYNGTSFASPAVAGIVALYLQKNPEAGYAEIKEAILSQARTDLFTGEDLPNNSWGYGKADAFRTLTGSWGCGDDDYMDAPQNINLLNVSTTKAMLDWDIIPNADAYQISYHKSGSPAQKTKAFTNTKTLNGLTPNSDYTCIIRAYCDGYGLSNWSDPFHFSTLPLKSGDVDFSFINIYPNPASTTLNIEGLSESCEIMILAITGNIVMQTVASAENNTFDISSLPNGIYNITIIEKDNTITKMISIIK